MAAGLDVNAASDEDLPEDGRRARRHRSRDLAVDALLDLLNEGVVRPTAQDVAERSGVSLRSLFRIFDDVQGLHAAATERHIARVQHLFVDVDGTGTLAERVEQLVSTTSRLFQSVAPVRRAAMRVAPESEPVQAQIQRARAWLLREISRALEPELRSQDAAVVGAVEALASFEAWDQMRSGQGLSDDVARAAVAAGIIALLS